MVASALNSEPYEQATSTSQIGFTVELLRLVGERAGLDVQFAKAVNHKDADQNITPGRPEDVAAKVAAGEADLGASSIPADAALEGVALSEPYLHADYAVVTKMDTGHDDLASIQDAGTVVAVQNDAAIAAWVAESLPEAEVVAFEDGIDALMELNSERAQAAIVDEPRFRRYVQVKEPHLQAVELVASDKDYAFAVAAGNEALLTAVNEALTALRARRFLRRPVRFLVRRRRHCQRGRRISRKGHGERPRGRAGLHRRLGPSPPRLPCRTLVYRTGGEAFVAFRARRPRTG